MTEMDPRIARTRNKVFAAALEVAASDGFADATVEAISAESGVSKSTIYRHWPDIASIFLDALESQKPPYLDIDHGNIRDDLVYLANGFANVLLSHQYGQLLPHLISAAARNTAFAQAQAAYTTARDGTAQAVLRRGVERGDLPEGTDLEWLQGQIFAPLLVRYLITHQPIDETWVTPHVDQTLDAILKASTTK